MRRISLVVGALFLLVGVFWAGRESTHGLGAARTKTFLGARYHRLARRRGKRRALVAVGNSILTIAHRLLSDPTARFSDLGPDWHDRIAPLRRKRQLIAELERLSGKKVLLQEAA